MISKKVVVSAIILCLVTISAVAYEFSTPKGDVIIDDYTDGVIDDIELENDVTINDTLDTNMDNLYMIYSDCQPSFAHYSAGYSFIFNNRDVYTIKYIFEYSPVENTTITHSNSSQLRDQKILLFTEELVEQGLISEVYLSHEIKIFDSYKTKLNTTDFETIQINFDSIDFSAFNDTYETIFCDVGAEQLAYNYNGSFFIFTDQGYSSPEPIRDFLDTISKILYEHVDN